MKLALSAAVALLACGCPGNGGGAKFPRTGPAPTPDQILARLAEKRAALHTFAGASVMDYFIGDQRLKGDVLVMGKPDRRVRFAALSPAGGSTIADMACDGSNFAFVDQQSNCQLTGPCDRSSIATFLRVELEPDDFVALALGNPPVPAGAAGTVAWDANRGVELVELSGAGGKLSLVIDSKGGNFDVLEAKSIAPDGAIAWQVKNAEFGPVTDEAGKTHRIPKKTKLESPRQKADLEVVWGERKFNQPIDQERFVLEVPAGLKRCGQP